MGLREIKFRVWSKKLYNKVIGISWASDKIIHIVVWNNELGRSKTLYPKDEPILLQYTGLKDKNGKEIYEGDIIKGYVDYFGIKQDEIIGVVCWHTFLTQFYVSVQWSKNITKMLLINELEDVEVIGNIYENPELLEEVQNAKDTSLA